MRKRPPKPEDIAAAPRHNLKNQKVLSAKVVQQDLPDDADISEEIPNEIKVAIASAVLAFSEMEMSAEHFIWDILGLSTDDGKLLTQIDTKEKFDKAKKLSERYELPIHANEKTAKEVWASVKLIVEARNKIAHGVWRMIDKTRPIVISYRIPIETGRINSEEFPLDRIKAIAVTSMKIKRLFDAMSVQVGLSKKL